MRHGVDAGCVEDLPDCGRGDRVAEAGEFALYPAVSPSAVLPGHAQDELFNGGRGGMSAGAAVPRECPFPGDELAVPGQQCGGGDREGLAPALARDEPRERGEPDPVCGLVADAGDLTAQHRVLMPQREDLSVLGHAAAQYGRRHLDQVPDQGGDDRQRHRRIIPGAIEAVAPRGEAAGQSRNRISERDKIAGASCGLVTDGALEGHVGGGRESRGGQGSRPRGPQSLPGRAARPRRAARGAQSERPAVATGGREDDRGVRAGGVRATPPPAP